jgi:hypothetical protein
MYTIIGEVHNSWRSLKDPFSDLQEAVAVAYDLIHQTHGGNIRVVDAQEARRLTGKDVLNNSPRAAYDLDGKRHEYNRAGEKK